MFVLPEPVDVRSGSPRERVVAYSTCCLGETKEDGCACVFALSCTDYVQERSVFLRFLVLGKRKMFVSERAVCSFFRGPPPAGNSTLLLRTPLHPSFEGNDARGSAVLSRVCFVEFLSGAQSITWNGIFLCGYYFFSCRNPFVCLFIL